MNNNKEENIKLTAIIYGDLVYWTTIVGTLVAIVGSTLSFVIASNVMDPAYVFEAIWSGNTVNEIWQQGAGFTVNGHWYLDYLNTGDGITSMGIVIGVVSVIPATLVTAIFLLKNGENFFASCALLSCFFLVISCLNIFVV